MKTRDKLRFKKIIIFFITFSFIIGLITVDEASSDMIGSDGALCLKTSRINQDWVSISFLGKEAKINMTKMKNTINKVQSEAKQILSGLYSQAKQLIKIEVIQEKESPSQLNEITPPLPLKTL
ncbi:MAG: hypothetical protein ACOX4P_05805 [Anaerovoracaceae bacterium]|jgi:predicted PurR-regulated permease PerM